MASQKKKAPKAKKSKPSRPAKPSSKAKPKVKVVKQVVVKPDPKTVQALRAAQKEAAAQKRETERLKSLLKREETKLKDLQSGLLAQKGATKQAEADRKAYEKRVEQERKAAQKDAERQAREAARKAEQEKKLAEREAEKQRKAEEKAKAQAEAQAAKLAAKKKPIPMSSLAATPIIRPLTGEPAAPIAPPPPPAKPGHVDNQVLSSISYGLFAAVNKTFGFAGQTVVKNAALRMLEYGYKRGWLPPKSKEPVRALNEFFGRLETMGYAEKIHVAKHGEKYALEVSGLADFDAVHELRSMHYPLLPIFLGEMLVAIVDQYFHLRVTMDPLEFQEQKRGFVLPFSIHEQMAAPEISKLPALSRVDDFEE
jgi:hypothetical protein